MTALCSKCGERPVHTRGLCSPCYQHARRSKKRIPVPQWECRTVKMLYCPRDPVMGVPLYPWPCWFPRLHFTETLAEGYWPDGCEVEYAIDYRGPKSKWVVSGCYLLEVGTGRVAEGLFTPGQHAVVQLVRV